MIITKTPFRVSLFGGGTDFPEWYVQNGGEVVSFSIDKYCYLTTRILPPFFENNFRIAYSKVETVKNYQEIEHPVVRESIRKFAPNLNLEVHHDGDLPARSGVGSSSAFTVGMIHALLTLQKVDVNQVQLANLAIEMEQKILRENVGCQDQISCALGGINHIKFGPGEKWGHKKIVLSEKELENFQNRLILVFTGVTRNSSEINSNIMKDLEKKSKYLIKLKSFASECKEILVNPNRWDDLGHMLDESWHLKKEINPSSTNSDLELLYARAKRAGALGGKILGAGGGGFFIFWVKEDSKRDFLSKFSLGLNVPFSISLDGSKVVYNSMKNEIEGAND